MRTDATVLVTGGHGFIGRHTIGPLREAGFDVHITARRDHAVEGVTSHVGDLHDRNFMWSTLEDVRPTHLLHLAWYTEHALFWESAENLRWVGTSLDLLHAFAECGGERAVVAGTCAEYSLSPEKLVEGQSPQCPRSLYGTSKAAVRMVATAFARERAVSLAWGYVFFLYGPDEASQRLVPSVVRSILRGEEARCTAGGQLRDFLHASDAGSAFAALLESSVEGGVNIASGVPLTVAEMATRAAAAAGNVHLLRLGAVPPSAGEPPAIVADTARLTDEVGWRPQLTLDDGLRDVVAWWRRELAQDAGA